MKKILICAACVVALSSLSAPNVNGAQVTEVTVSDEPAIRVSVPNVDSFVIYISKSPISNSDIASEDERRTGFGTYVFDLGVRFSAIPPWKPAQRISVHPGSDDPLRGELTRGQTYYIRFTFIPVGGSMKVLSPQQLTITLRAPEPPTPPEPTPEPPPPEPTPPEPEPEPIPEPITPTGELIRHTRIYFANGVGNSGWEALSSRERLKKEYDEPFNADPSRNPPYPGTYSFRMAYNPTEGVFWDIVSEVLVQKWKETAILEENSDVQELKGFLLRRTLKYWIRRARGGNSEAPQRVRQLLKRIKPPLNNATINAFTPTVLRQLTTALNQRSTIIPGYRSRLGTGARHAVKYETELKKGNRVFVVSHSQGNLFANVALEAVARRLPACEFSLEQIGVATPANRQFRRHYHTGTDDLVINLLRPIYTVLPATVTNGPRSGFWSFLDQNHAFVEEYMKRDHKSFADIDWDMKSIAVFAPFPEPYPPPTC